MEIKKLTGVLKSEELSLTKGIANLIIGFSKDFSKLTNERISVWIEKKDGVTNICRSVLLKDFIILGCYGEDTIQYGNNGADFYNTIANIELTEDGGFISLAENETIKIQLTDLKSAETYLLVGVEGAEPTHNVRRYERKVVAGAVTSHEFDLRGFDLMSMQKDYTIEEIDFRMDNGTVIKMTPFEMETQQKSIDPLQFFAPNETGDQIPVHQFADRISFPLAGVNSITIRKSNGSDLNFHFRIDYTDYHNFGHHLVN